MSKPLRIVKPIAIGTSQLVSSSVAETDYTAWNAATNYAAGDRCIRTATHRIYQRIVPGTTATAPESDPTNWLDVGATNRWKMFDTKVSSQTVAASPIVVTLSPDSVFNAVALLNLSATSIRVKVTDDNDGVVYDETFSLASPPTSSSYWTWFFEEPVMKTKLVADDLPSYGRSAEVEITITNTAGDAKCGVYLVGIQRQIGDQGIHSRPQVGITDYSRKEKNEFGELELVERAWSDRSSFSMLIPNRSLDAIKSLFAGIRTTPVLWIASDDFDALVIYGIYKEFSAVISYPEDAEFNLEIEGLI